MRKILFGTLIAMAAFLFSCTKQIPNRSSAQAGTTATVKMSNGWWVNVSVKGQPGNLFSTPVFFQTYNTASNSPDSLWVDDLGNFWNFRIVATANYANLTFSAMGITNKYYADTVNISNGKVLLKAGHSRAGNITDSIYMETQFSDDSPAFGNTYIIAGTARTGFDEDDY